MHRRGFCRLGTSLLGPASASVLKQDNEYIMTNAFPVAMSYHTIAGLRIIIIIIVATRHLPVQAVEDKQGPTVPGLSSATQSMFTCMLLLN